MSKYSLWVSPEKGSELHTKLQNLIENLAKRFQTPVFEPHVTLLGDIEATPEISDKVTKLSQMITPYKITLDFLDYTDNLYQSLVIRTLATLRVLDANKKTRDVFNRHSDSLYVPHISLIYVRDLENQVKQGLIKEIGDQFKGVEFLAESIQISEQLAGGRIEDWKIFKEIPING